MPGIAAENEGYLYGIADAESRRFFGSADDDLSPTTPEPRAGWWRTASNWSGDPLLESTGCADLLIDRLFCYLDESADHPGA
jgi:hypothetical protein